MIYYHKLHVVEYAMHRQHRNIIETIKLVAMETRTMCQIFFESTTSILNFVLHLKEFIVLIDLI